jgi:hypothetical protein
MCGALACRRVLPEVVIVVDIVYLLLIVGLYGITHWIVAALRRLEGVSR